MSKYHDRLIARLEAHPEETDVYFNEAGGWSFHPREGYDKHVTRDEVLGISSDEKPETKTKQKKSE